MLVVIFYLNSFVIIQICPLMKCALSYYYDDDILMKCHVYCVS